jgi:hypothetical protein
VNHALHKLHETVSWNLILGAVIVVLSGCTEDAKPKIISCGELTEISKHWQEPKVAAWSYEGTQNGYHYFHYDDLPRPSEYRVSEREIHILEPYELTSDRNKWRVLPWGPAAFEAKKKSIPQNVCGDVRFLI